MAFLHDATLVPSKKRLLTAWLPEQPWFTSVSWDPVGSFRLDDPLGEVGCLHGDRDREGRQGGVGDGRR